MPLSLQEPKKPNGSSYSFHSWSQASNTLLCPYSWTTPEWFPLCSIPWTTKHIRVACHFARELTDEQIIAPQRVATDKNLADVFTKSLGNAT